MKDRIERVKLAIQNQLTEINKLTGVNSLILSVCLVDTIAGFYCGYKGEKTGNRNRYLKFVERYLKSHKTYLYDLRCNLTHSFSNTVSNFLFVDDKEFTRVFEGVSKILDWTVFNIDSFKKDLQIAIDNYFTDLNDTSNNDIRLNFDIRYNHLNILEDSTIPTIRNLKGEMIFKHTDLDTLPGTNVKIAMLSPTKIKK